MPSFIKCLVCDVVKKIDVTLYTDGDILRGLCGCIDEDAAKNALNLTAPQEVIVIPDGALWVEHEVRYKELIEILDKNNVDYEIEVLPEGKNASYDGDGSIKIIGRTYQMKTGAIHGGTNDTVEDKELYEFLSNFGWYAKVLLRIREYDDERMTEFGIGCIAEEQPDGVLLVSHGNVE